MDLDEIRYTKVFAGAGAETRDANIPWNSDLLKLPYFYDNFTSFFVTKFNVQLQTYNF